MFYMELAAGATLRQRQDVAGLVREISKFDTIANPSPEITTWELDQYFRVHHRRPRQPRAVQVFGRGYSHVFPEVPRAPTLAPKPGAEPIQLDPGKKNYIEQFAAQVMEMAILVGPSAGTNLPNYDRRAHRAFDDQFVAEENRFAATLQKLPRRHWAAAQYMRSLVTDVEPLIDGVLSHAAFPATVLPTSWDGWVAMLKELPTLWAITELKRVQHLNPGRKWERQDHSDLVALTMAVVHCDVVVFEKHWSDMARRAKLDSRNGTVLSTLRSLPTDLFEAERARSGQ
jgi:hypothetical protein